MKNTRREFSKFLSGLAFAPDYRNYKQRFNMSGYAAPKIEKVRIGIIGLGNRGPAIWKPCDASKASRSGPSATCGPNGRAGQETARGTIHNPTLYSGNKDEWMKLCEQEDIDLVIVTTPYYMHAQHGRVCDGARKTRRLRGSGRGHDRECWKLVETAERPANTA